MYINVSTLGARERGGLPRGGEERLGLNHARIYMCVFKLEGNGLFFGFKLMK